MRLITRWLAISRFCFAAGLALLLTAFCFVQLQQRLLRHRAERLLADFQSIRLYQTTWTDAQSLMHRWGAWGHYDGVCTSVECDYTITLSDVLSEATDQTYSDRVWRLLGYVDKAYELLGGKEAKMKVGFRVQDGTIWRSFVALRLAVPPHTQRKDDEYGYSLGVLAKASDSLHQRYDAARQRDVGPWVLGTDDQLEQHPNYKEGRPGGCEWCLNAEVTFTPAISVEELRQVTNYNLSCLTQFRHCVNLPDILPTARDWHLYPSTEPAYQEPPLPPPHPCAVPLFAVARDGGNVMLVDVLSVGFTKREEFGGGLVDVTTARVRLLRMIKGAMPLSTGEIFTTQPWSGDVQQSQTAEALIPGKRYILIPWKDAQLPSVILGFCGVFEDSPEAEQQLKEGFAQNDLLRHRDGFGGTW